MVSYIHHPTNPLHSLDKSRVLSLILHSCDVSHPAKVWDLHHQWTSRCMEEFFKQGDREKEQGLEFSPLCDRHNTMVPQSQIGFIDFIVVPTLTVCGDMVTTVLGGVVCEDPWTMTLPTNRARWQEKVKRKEELSKSRMTLMCCRRMLGRRVLIVLML